MWFWLAYIISETFLFLYILVTYVLSHNILLKENYKVSKILNRHRANIYYEMKKINGEYSFENTQSDVNTKLCNAIWKILREIRKNW